MNDDWTVFRDPKTGSRMLRPSGDALVTEDGIDIPLVNGIPRFVSTSNYAEDFGKQWNLFPATQLDSHSGLDISEKRLERCMNGKLPQVSGKRILEAGSGAGRFTEILLKHGAHVHSFDFSNAVEANARNNGSSDRLTLAQADIRQIPFEKASYDFAVCLGVLQHTPNPEESIQSLWKMLKPGGTLVIDHYRWSIRWLLPPPFRDSVALYRQIILRIPPEHRFAAVQGLTDFWFPLHWHLRDSITSQRILRRLSPVIFHYPSIPLPTRQSHYEWALLDTHDSTTDRYKHLRTPRQIREILSGLGATDIQVTVGGNGVEASCCKPH